MLLPLSEGVKLLKHLINEVKINNLRKFWKGYEAFDLFRSIKFVISCRDTSFWAGLSFFSNFPGRWKSPSAWQAIKLKIQQYAKTFLFNKTIFDTFWLRFFLNKFLKKLYKATQNRIGTRKFSTFLWPNKCSNYYVILFWQKCES